MINITVKTLDSQNHQFTVESSLTVEQFKSYIAEQVNVPAASQRIIYCGRVLQDSVKLADYDVDGKVVHLVQRAPPNSTNRNSRSVTPPPDTNRPPSGFRGFDRAGNTLYMGMGSMTFPQGLMDPQQMIPARATQILGASRLNVARRMLRNAENVIRQLENPAGSNEPASQPEEPVEEEMTPVIEARVIVPSTGDQPIDGNAILNAVQNTIFPAIGNLDSMGPSTSSANPEDSTTEQPTPRVTPTTASTGNSNSTAGPSSNRTDVSRSLREMGVFLTTLNQLQFRFAPFLARYQAFLQDDPQVSQENIQETQQMLNRVSQVLHFLGHAYHSLSDLIINVDQPPPRLVYCRPIFMQPPAVVQAGIPIQVEAQINLSADRPTSAPNTNTSLGSSASSASFESDNEPGTPTNATVGGQTQSQGQPTTNTSTAGSSTNSVGAASSDAQPSTQRHSSITLQPGFVGLPFMPTGSMRVITAPMEIHTLRSSASRPRPTNNNNNAATTTSSTPQTQSTPTPAQPASTNNESRQRDGPPNQNQGNGQFGPQNGNLEFFMEVTPEALRGGNFIQSIMHLVGSQLGDVVLNQAQSQRADNTTQPNLVGGTQGQSQPSQARSTQTNPTTATHTRSTPRPHVHMTQQAVQGGFDPFLPCHSHHLDQSRSARIVSMVPPPNSQGQSTGRQTASASDATSTPPNQPLSEPTGPPSRLPNIAVHIEDMVRGLPVNNSNFPNMFGNQQTARMMADTINQALRHISSQQAPPPRGAPDGQNQNSSSEARPTHDMFSFINTLMEQNLPDLLESGPSLDEFVQSFHMERYVQGESLIIDLIMMLLRNLRLNDLFSLSTGNMAPLQRQIEAIQTFFRTEICQNDTTGVGITRATERIINDFTPIINAVESIPPRENIDMVRTFDGFFRQRVPDIIRLAINSGSNMEGGNPESASNLLNTIWRATKELLALAIHCSANGQQGVEDACEQLMFSTIFNQANVPNEVHHWTITSGRTALRTICQNLEVGPSDIEQYIIRNMPHDPVISTTENMQQEQNGEVERQSSVESMDVDYVASPTNSEPVLAATPIRVEEAEPLPNCIWGSEPWHRQTPQDWVPIITRDVQKQRKQNIQPPFSDAYLSGMPSKRRKLINNSKPQGSLPQVISESIRQAVTSTGLTSAAPLDVVSQAASESVEIQTAYRSLLQSTVQSNLRNNEEFNAERYPNTAHYFNESSTE